MAAELSPATFGMVLEDLGRAAYVVVLDHDFVTVSESQTPLIVACMSSDELGIMDI